MKHKWTEKFKDKMQEQATILCAVFFREMQSPRIPSLKTAHYIHNFFHAHSVRKRQLAPLR
jgi:hypothetical protein